MLSDQIIEINSRRSNVDHPVRLAVIQGKPHTSRGHRDGRKLSSTGPSSGGSIRLVTGMLDVPADLIASIYLNRYHCLHLDLSVHGPVANEEDVRDDLLLLERLGKPERIGDAHQKIKALVYSGALRFERTELVR